MNKEKALIRERTRLRRRQNPSAVDFRRIRRLRKTRTKYWLLRKRSGVFEIPTKTKTKKKEKKEKEPELEEIQEPEIETISDSEIDELYALDEEDIEEDEPTSEE